MLNLRLILAYSEDYKVKSVHQAEINLLFSTNILAELLMLFLLSILQF